MCKSRKAGERKCGVRTKQGSLGRRALVGAYMCQIIERLRKESMKCVQEQRDLGRRTLGNTCELVKGGRRVLVGVYK